MFRTLFLLTCLPKFRIGIYIITYLHVVSLYIFPTSYSRILAWAESLFCYAVYWPWSMEIASSFCTILIICPLLLAADDCWCRCKEIRVNVPSLLFWTCGAVLLACCYLVLDQDDEAPRLFHVHLMFCRSSKTRTSRHMFVRQPKNNNQHTGLVQIWRLNRWKLFCWRWSCSSLWAFYTGHRSDQSWILWPLKTLRIGLDCSICS